MKQPQPNEKSPFTRYREGYVDGYHAREIRMSEDNDYLRGYKEGNEDDIEGVPNRFPEDPLG